MFTLHAHSYYSLLEGTIPVEDIGLLKIDLLSQRSIGVLKDTMRRINEVQANLSGLQVYTIE